MEKKNGFGKEYYSNGNLQFEGIQKENMKWEGKGFNIDGEFEYEIKNGNGRIIQYKEVAVAILKFEGEILNGVINGYGKEYNKELIFEGFYKNGEKNTFFS